MSWLSRAKREARERAAEKRRKQSSISLREYGNRGMEVGAWCNGLPWGTAFVGILGIGNAERIYYFLLKLDKQKAKEQVSGSDLEQRLAYYEKPVEAVKDCGRALLRVVEPDRRVRDRLGDAWGFIVDRIVDRIQASEHMGLWKRGRVLAESIIVSRGVNELRRRMFLYTLEHHGEEEFDFLRPGSAAAEELMSVPAVRFVLRVLVPCWYEHKRLPWDIFASARAGSNQDIEDLLQMDADILGDTAVRAHVWQKVKEGSEAVMKDITRQVASESVTGVNRQSVNVVLAALVSRVSEALGAKKMLTAPQIRDLFDAYSSHANEEWLPDDLKKEIWREKRRWRIWSAGTS
jgi:hypothetical protein